MGGEVAVSSAPGSGSTFVVSLPVDATSPLLSTPRPVTSIDEPELGQVPSDAPLVVVIDAPLRALVERSLIRSGWQVSTATNGIEALEALERAPPDIVLLDLMMPVMDGFEFLATLRSRPEHQTLPVIVVTARTSRGPTSLRKGRGERRRFAPSGVGRRSGESDERMKRGGADRAERAVRPPAEQPYVEFRRVRIGCWR